MFVFYLIIAVLWTKKYLIPFAEETSGIQCAVLRSHWAYKYGLNDIPFALWYSRCLLPSLPLHPQPILAIEVLEKCTEIKIHSLWFDHRQIKFRIEANVRWALNVKSVQFRNLLLKNYGKETQSINGVRRVFNPWVIVHTNTPWIGP